MDKDGHSMHVYMCMHAVECKPSQKIVYPNRIQLFYPLENIKYALSHLAQMVRDIALPEGSRGHEFKPEDIIMSALLK